MALGEAVCDECENHPDETPQCHVENSLGPTNGVRALARRPRVSVTCRCGGCWRPRRHFQQSVDFICDSRKEVAAFPQPLQEDASIGGGIGIAQTLPQLDDERTLIVVAHDLTGIDSLSEIAEI
jgi:hypothetical protein